MKLDKVALYCLQDSVIKDITAVYMYIKHTTLSKTTLIQKGWDSQCCQQSVYIYSLHSIPTFLESGMYGTYWVWYILEWSSLTKSVIMNVK